VVAGYVGEAIVTTVPGKPSMNSTKEQYKARPTHSSRIPKEEANPNEQHQTEEERKLTTSQR